MSSTTLSSMNGDGDHHGLVAVPQMAADLAGAVVWWRLEGAVDYAALIARLTEAGVHPDLHPLLPTSAAALQRAVHRQASRGILARPLHRGGAWALVRETRSGDDRLDYEQLVAVRTRHGAFEARGYGDTPEITALADQVGAAYLEEKARLAPVDVSAWLSTYARRLGAVSLREGGGIYFVLASERARWLAAAGALVGGSRHRIYELPAMRSDEAVRAVLDAVAHEAAGAAADMEQELAEGLSLKSLEHRQARCVAVAGKIEKYEAALGESLGELRGRLVRLRANLAAAALAAQAAEDEKEEG